jgi:hypothetical protein
MFQKDKKVLMDTFGRVDRQYGPKLTIDLPNDGGRSSAAFYFIAGDNDRSGDGSLAWLHKPSTGIGKLTETTALRAAISGRHRCV